MHEVSERMNEAMAEMVEKAISDIEYYVSEAIAHYRKEHRVSIEAKYIYEAWRCALNRRRENAN